MGRGGSAARHEGVFAASVWRSDDGVLVGRVQIGTGHAEPTVSLTGTAVEISEAFLSWLAEFERGPQAGSRTSS